MNNILGLEKVLEHLKVHNDCYVIIGGIATKIVLEEKGFTSRATKDFDIVVLADATKKEFSKDIVKFLKDGQYQNGFTNNKRVCYRFVNPKSNGYPKIIELFSLEHDEAFKHHLEKIPIIMDNEELSAIVLNKDVFDFINQRKIISSEGLSVVDALGLIVLKVHAYFNNLTLYSEKKITDKNDYLKHKNDVIRLLVSLTGNEQPLSLPLSLYKDCCNFVDILVSSKKLIKQITSSNVSIDTIINIYKKLFSIK